MSKDTRAVPKHRGGRPTKRPPVEVFNALYSASTQEQMAKHYGVSVYTIRAWIKKYNQEAKEGDAS